MFPSAHNFTDEPNFNPAPSGMTSNCFQTRLNVKHLKSSPIFPLTDSAGSNSGTGNFANKPRTLGETNYHRPLK